MKSYLKRGGAFALAMLLLVSLLPMSVFAFTTPSHPHVCASETVYPPNWSTNNGGYVYEYSICDSCGQKFHLSSGNDAMYVGCITPEFQAANNGYVGHALYPQVNSADYTACNGGYQESYRLCHCGQMAYSADGTRALTRAEASHSKGTVYSGNDTYAEAAFYCANNCGAVVNENGAVIQPVTSGGTQPPIPSVAPGPCSHEADLSRYEQANYHPCTGGIESAFYLCKHCDAAVDENGNELPYKEPSAKHDVSGNYIPADPDCVDGIREEHRVCSVCQQPINKNEQNAVGGPATVSHEKSENSQVVNGQTVYPCKHGCGQFLNDNNEVITPDGGNGNECTKHEPNEDGLQESSFTACNGGYQEEFFVCKHCDLTCDKDGNPATFIEGDGKHTLGGEKQPANYQPCDGGYKDAYQVCTACYAHCNENGEVVEFFEATEPHIPGGELKPANWTACCPGFAVDHYECTRCNAACTATGESVPITGGEEPDNHKRGEEKYDADWTVCEGGFKTDWYCCEGCGAALDAEGKRIEFAEGTGKHTPGVKQDVEPWTACGGGVLEDCYECADCTMLVNADGEPIEWMEPDEGVLHTPGTELQEPTYSPCNGGHKEAFYICEVCHHATNAAGKEVEWVEGTEGGSHTPGTEECEPNYVPCEGGIKVNHYVCVGCGTPVNAEGEPVEVFEGDGKHTIVKVPAQAPTYDEIGWKEYYECKYCYMAYADAAGKVEITEENVYDFILPKLTKTEIVSGVPNPPAGKTGAVVKAEMQQAAMNADSGMKADKAKSVLMDITLKQKNDKGEWENVTEENFPEEGVTVLLPYPAGVNKNNYKNFSYVITHMKHDGSVEIITHYTLQEDGILATFLSLSPVMITYQAKTTGANPNVPLTGDTADWMLWSGTLVLSAAAVVVLAKKKRA